MGRKFLWFLALLLSLGLQSQNTTVSPYSFFGIGDLRENRTIENRLMGGLSVYGDSIHVNLRNPAAFSKLRLTTYTAAISHNEIELEEVGAQDSGSLTNLEYLVVAFPISKNAGVGFGIAPLSSVGYDLTTITTNAEGQSVINVFEGTGGLNRVFFSGGWSPVKNLSFGATANFSFGTLTNERAQAVEDVRFGAFEDRVSRVNGFDFVYSLNYTPRIGKYTLFSSVVIDTQVNLSSENSQRIGSFVVPDQVAFTGDVGEVEVIDVNLANQGLARTDLTVPTTTTVGLGFGRDRKWFIGGEYGFQEFSEFRNEFLDIDNVSYQDVQRIALGGFYIPNHRSLGSYFNKITYRAGLRYENTGLVVNGTEIDDFGITFGFGLPLNNNFSNINFGVEFGQRGTTDNNLTQENYLTFNLGLSFNDRWFRKLRVN